MVKSEDTRSDAINLVNDYHKPKEPEPETLKKLLEKYLPVRAKDEPVN